jgi:hypothetical protein
VSRERDIEDALAAADLQAKVEAEPEAGGSRITVEVDGVTHRFSIGDGRSALLNFLLTGHVD